MHILTTTTLAVAMMLGATMAQADGPGNPYERPPVYTPPEAKLTWGGFYAGVGVTTTKTSETGETETYERSCKSKSQYSHNGNKCQISQHDFEYLRDTGQFSVVQNPWSKHVDGPVIYQSGYYGLWMNGAGEVRYMSDDDGDAPTSARKPVVNTVLDTITDVFVIGEDEEIAANAFVGYRHPFGVSGFAMGVEFGAVGGAELQLASSQGRWFAYTGFNSDEEATLGADRLMGQDGNWFVGGKFATGENTRFEARVGLNF